MSPKNSRHTPCAVRSTTRSASICLAVSAVLLSTIFPGCQERSNIRPVKGKLTLNGEPLANANVSFQPLVQKKEHETAEGLGSYGRTNASGEFELRLVDSDERGALIGTHAVRISIAQRGMRDDQISTADKALPRSVRDGSEKFTVEAEKENFLQLDLKTK